MNVTRLLVSLPLVFACERAADDSARQAEPAAPSASAQRSPLGITTASGAPTLAECVAGCVRRRQAEAVAAPVIEASCRMECAGK